MTLVVGHYPSTLYVEQGSRGRDNCNNMLFQQQDIALTFVLVIDRMLGYVFVKLTCST